MSTFDFVFAWDGASGPTGPWSHLEVAEIRGHERISGLYSYDLTLIAKLPSPPVAPAELIGKRATLRITTNSVPAYKVVHGVITEAREAGEVALVSGMAYEVRLEPPLARARHRRRSRIFLDKTPRFIIEKVLRGEPLMELSGDGAVEDDLGGPDFSPADEQFCWRVKDTSRLDDARVRAYCVQYNETDFDFVSRLLEDEGISYHVENGAGRSLLVLTDHDGGRPRLSPAVIGPGVDGREVSHFRLGARLRPSAVTLDDHNWKRPSTDMIAAAKSGRGAEDLVEYIYPGGYPDAPSQGEPLARARAERHAVEASYAAGDGTLRVLSAGSIAALVHPKSRYDGEYLITDLRVRGYQAGVGYSPGGAGEKVPFSVEIECARRGKGLSVEESKFRPARSAPRPRIAGTQAAIVTEDPSTKGAEINVGGPDGLSEGCVRVRFYWDSEPARLAKEPASSWVRVSQVFGGAGEGGVWHPRVGTEVIVDYEEGDPDRPIVIGRVYNGKNLPPYGGSPVHSTFKSLSSPGGGVFNEFTFDDSAGKELMFMNAGKDMTSIVGNDRLEDVSSNAMMKVGADNTELIGANETVSIGVNDTLGIGANDGLLVGANSSTQVGASCISNVGAHYMKSVGASQTITVASSLTEEVGGAVTETYAATRSTLVSGAITETLGASRFVTVAGTGTQTYGPQVILVWGNRTIDVGGSLSTTVGGAVIQIVLGSHITNVTGTDTTRAGAAIVFMGPLYQVGRSAAHEFNVLNLAFTGLSLNAVGYQFKENKFTFSYTGASVGVKALVVDVCAFKTKKVGAKTKSPALRVCLSGLLIHKKGLTCIV